MRSRILWGVALVVLAAAALVVAPLPSVLTTSGARGWAPLALAEEGAHGDGDNDEVVQMGVARGYRLLDLEWSPGPFPGSKIALLAGDPKTGMHHAYLKLADGTHIPPHWHSSDEYVTVVSGTMMFGQAETVDTKAARLFGPGAFLYIPAKAPHYAWAKGEVVLSQTRGGALDIHWVNPDDDPANAKKAAPAPAAKP